MRRSKKNQMLLLFFVFVCEHSFSQQKALTPEWVTAIQDVRASAHLRDLIWDENLAQAAESYSRELSKRGELSHRDVQNRDAGARLSAVDYPMGTVGEILGAGEESNGVVSAWLKSPPHHEILLENSWERWGAGEYNSGTTRVYVVYFWKP